MSVGLDVAAAALEEGSVVAVATESSFGLLARVDSTRALDRLFLLKPRDVNRGVGLVLPTRESWTAVVDTVPALAALLADALWPGPLSIALPARPQLDQRLTVDGTVAVRWPGVCAAARLAHRVGVALTATSANPPGAPAPTTSAAVRASFHGVSDLHIVEGVAPGGEPSTLVSVAAEQARLIRPGAVPESRLRELLGSRLVT